MPHWEVLVCRHAGTIEWLRREFGTAVPLDAITGNATPDDVRGKRVLGVLPLHLAAVASSVTEVELTPPPRGEELTAEQVAERKPRLRTFRVHEERSQATATAAPFPDGDWRNAPQWGGRRDE